MLTGSAIILSRFVDANKFKGRMSQYVYAKTGQVLVINGNMHWSFFPWIGIKANGLTYYNAPNFTPKIFVSAKEMDVKVKVLPLLTGKVEISNITLNNAVLNLIKTSSGHYNWQTLAKPGKQPEEAQTTHTTGNLSHLSIASLKIKNGKLNWYDQKSNNQTHINSLNISSRHIQFGQPFPLSLQFNLLNDNKRTVFDVDLLGDILISKNSYALNHIKLKANYFNDGRKIDIKGLGNLGTDFEKQTLLANLRLHVNSANAQISINGQALNKAPHLTGTINIEDSNLKDILNDLGKPLQTQDKDALKSASLLAKFDMQNKLLKLTSLHAKLDETDIDGKFTLETDTKKIQFDLNANKINISHYLSNSEDSQKKAVIQADTKQENVKAPEVSPWKVTGLLKVSELKVDKLMLNNVSARLDSKNNLIKLSPLQAILYKGHLEGTVTIDKRQSDKTSIVLKQSIKNLDVKDLLHAFSDSDKLSGQVNLSANLNSITNNKTSFLSALNGNLHFDLSNGSVKGIDIIYQLSRAHAFIKRLPKPAMTDSKQTDFALLSANFGIDKGIFNTDDLTLTSPYLKVTGKGSANLINKEIRYKLNALAQPKLANENKEIGKEVLAYQVPIKVSGKLTKPSVNLDFIELAKIFYTKKIEKPVTQQVQKNINHLKENLTDKMKINIQEKMKDYAPSKLLDKLPFSKASK